MRDELEDQVGLSTRCGIHPPRGAGTAFPHRLADGAGEIRRLVAGIEHHAHRRLARDSERIDGYYRELLRQMEQRMARRGRTANGREGAPPCRRTPGRPHGQAGKLRAEILFEEPPLSRRAALSRAMSWAC